MRQVLTLLALAALFVSTLAYADESRCPPGHRTKITVEHPDNFQGPTQPSPSVVLNEIITQFWGIPLRWFDQAGINTAFGHTFSDLPSGICGATLRVKVRALGDIPYTDTIRLEYEDKSRHEPFAWRITIRNIIGTWETGMEAELELDLAHLPKGVRSVTDVLYSIQDGTLDVVVEEDTMVDYLILEYCTRCTEVSTEAVSWGHVKAMYRE